MLNPKIFGILRCPYRHNCGPDEPLWEDTNELREAQKKCYTRGHYQCEVYISKKNTERFLKKSRKL